MTDKNCSESGYACTYTSIPSILRYIIRIYTVHAIILLLLESAVKGTVHSYKYTIMIIRSGCVSRHKITKLC